MARIAAAAAERVGLVWLIRLAPLVGVDLTSVIRHFSEPSLIFS